MTTTTGNSQAICVSGGPTGNFTNVVLTSVTVCVPGTTTCTTIPNVQVDTGSSGLRLFHSQVSSLNLPAQLLGAAPYYECAAFADGVVWGSVAKADVSMAGEKASGVSVQLILDDQTSPAIPGDCQSQGTEENTPAAIGANGIVGVGLFVQDCGQACVTAVTPRAQYYTCSSGCTDADILLSQQVTNPVSAFSVDKNGVVLQLPAIPNDGFTSVAGTIIFGINTASNNQLGSAVVITVPNSGSSAGSFNLTLNGGTTYSESFIDSGSSAYFFNDTAIAQCPAGVAQDYLCPGASSSLSLLTPTISIQGSNGAVASSSVKLANAQFLFDQSNAATLFVFNDLGAPAGTTLPNAFDLGVPFFFGRSVYTGLESSTTPAGPFFAWAPFS